MPWLKWTPAETHDITILSSDPVESFVHWLPSGSQPCTGTNCQYCAVAGRPKHRWSVEIRKGEENFTWEMSNQVYTNLAAISHKLKAFAGIQLSITRNGSGLVTTYTLIPTGTVDVETLPPATISNTPASHFGASIEAENHRTAVAVAETIKILCTNTGLDAKAEFVTWIADKGKEYADSSIDVQLERFCDYLEDCTAQPKKEEPAPTTAESLL